MHLSAGVFLILGNIHLASSQTIGVTYISEMQYSPISNKGNWCNLLRTDGELYLYKNGALNGALLNIYKLNPHRLIDDLMTYSNIEEENKYFALSLLGYTQYIGQSSLFIGIRNMNEDYFTSPITSLFTNSSCGIYPTISTNYAIANYPYSSFGIHFNGCFNNWNIKASIYNGVGYNGWSKYNNPFIINYNRDGLFSIVELNYHTDYGKYFCGVSSHNRLYKYEEDNEIWEETVSKASKKINASWWAYLEQSLFKRYGNQINLLLQYSANSNKNNFCKRYGGAGIAWTSINTKLRQHNLGVVITGAQFYHSYELDTEITYQYQPISNLLIQTSIHLVKNKIDLSPILMLRLGYTFEYSFCNKSK